MRLTAKLARVALATTALLGFVSWAPVVAVTALQPAVPMMLRGTVYVNGELAPDGTELTITLEGDVVASGSTPRAGGGTGSYEIELPSEEDQDQEVRCQVGGEPAAFLVDGEEQDAVPYAPGTQEYDITLGDDLATNVLTIGVEGEGQTDPAPGDHQRPDGASVEIRAAAAAGWQFDRWSGPVDDPNAARTQVTMDGDVSIAAVFSLQPTTAPGTEAPTPTSAVAVPLTPTPSATATSTAATTELPGTATGSAPTSTSMPTQESTNATPADGDTGELTEMGTSTSPSGTSIVGTTESPTEGGAGPSEGTAEEGAAGSDEGEMTASPGSASTTEDRGMNSPGLIIGAVALAVLGIAAVVLGVRGLRVSRGGAEVTGVED